MRPMATLARLVGVQTHGVHGTLRLVVTSHAGGGLSVVLAEGVAILAGRRGHSAMQRRGDRRVAALAQRSRRRCELAVAVAVGTWDLAEVRCMARTLAHV